MKNKSRHPGCSYSLIALCIVIMERRGILPSPDAHDLHQLSYCIDLLTNAYHIMLGGDAFSCRVESLYALISSILFSW